MCCACGRGSSTVSTPAPTPRPSISPAPTLCVSTDNGATSVTYETCANCDNYPNNCVMTTLDDDDYREHDVLRVQRGLTDVVSGALRCPRFPAPDEFAVTDSRADAKPVGISGAGSGADGLALFSQYREASSGFNYDAEIFNPTATRRSIWAATTRSRCAPTAAAPGPRSRPASRSPAARAADPGGKYLVCHMMMDGDTSASTTRADTKPVVSYSGGDFQQRDRRPRTSPATSTTSSTRSGCSRRLTPARRGRCAAVPRGAARAACCCSAKNSASRRFGGGLAFMDDFSGTCPWIALDQYTTPYAGGRLRARARSRRRRPPQDRPIHTDARAGIDADERASFGPTSFPTIMPTPTPTRPSSL